MKRLPILYLILVLLVFGCSNTTDFIIKDEVVAQIVQRSPGSASIKKDGIEMSVDTRQPNFWQRNMVPLFQRIMAATEGSLEVP